MTLDEWLDIWLDTCKKNCRNTTKRTYTIQYNRLRKELGWRKQTSLNLVVVQRAFNELGSDKSRQDCRAVLVDMLNRAMEADLLNKNVALGINTKIECAQKKERRVLTDEEIDMLFEVMQNGGYMYPITVMALRILCLSAKPTALFMKVMYVHR